MTDKLFSFNSKILPAPSIIDDPTPVVQLVDPTLYQLSVFFKQLLNTNLQPRFSEEANLCGLTHANLDNWVDGYAVAQVTDFPLHRLTLEGNDFKFPMLNVLVEEEFPDQLTLTNVSIKRDFVVSYVLPPLTARQYNKLYSFLKVAAKVFIDYGQQGYDPKVNPSGPSVWQTAGLSFGTLNSIKYDKFPGLDKTGKMPVDFPCMQFRLSFWERNQLPVAQNYEAFTGIDLLELDYVPESNPGNPINNFIDGYVYPDINLSSVLPSVGSIAGGTLITIKGTGFLSQKIQSASQLTVCGVPVAQVVVKSPTILMAITNPGVIGTENITGDIVLADNVGHVYTLANSFTYVPAT